MPRGTYALLDDGAEAGLEQFTSAPGPMGWRYFATIQRGGALDRVDVSVDARGRPVRARIAAGDHELLIAARGAALAAIHDGSEIELEAGAGTAFSYPSPGFLAVALHRLEASTEEAVLAIDPETLAPRLAPRESVLLGEGTIATPAGAFDGRRWRVDGREVTIADTVVLTAEGLAELRTYERGASGPEPRLRTV